MNRKLLICSLFFLIATFGFLSCKNSDKLPEEKTGEKTQNMPEEEPDPDLVYIGDIPVYTKFEALEPLFHQKNDTTYVINFWATWCKPCVEELPYFEQLHDQYKGEKVRVILVSLDFPKQIESKVVPFVKKHQLKSDVVVLAEVNGNNYINKVEPTWSGAIPVTIVYNAKDRKFIGDQLADYQELEEILQSFL